ncbi:hypothetical protein KUV46_15585 [Thalassovita mediterranea]|nr:hypothetical protein KUV46_15585 [Thalassovita mediterranea]
MQHIKPDFEQALRVLARRSSLVDDTPLKSDDLLRELELRTTLAERVLRGEAANNVLADLRRHEAEIAENLQNLETLIQNSWKQKRSD